MEILQDDERVDDRTGDSMDCHGAHVIDWSIVMFIKIKKTMCIISRVGKNHIEQFKNCFVPQNDSLTVWDCGLDYLWRDISTGPQLQPQLTPFLHFAIFTISSKKRVFNQKIGNFADQIQKINFSWGKTAKIPHLKP